MIEYQQDIKYQMHADATWRLVTGININYSIDCGWYGVVKESGIIFVRKGFAWDGATMFPDFRWILEGSLWHDVLHLLIAKGAIPESENDNIDRELSAIIRICGGRYQQSWLSRIRGWYVKMFTRLVHQQVTQARPVYRLKRGKRERIK